RAGGVDIVAHDIGTWIGLAHAAAYPGDVRRLVVTEANVPGVSPPTPAGVPSEAMNLKSWQFAFNRLDDLPEMLVQGHERAYLAWIFVTKSTRTDDSMRQIPILVIAATMAVSVSGAMTSVPEALMAKAPRSSES